MRSATRKGYGALGATCLVAVALAPFAQAAVAPSGGSASEGSPRVVIAMLDRGVGPRVLAGVPGVSPGLLSAGLGRVRLEQTYLDVGQGNRVFGSLYEGGLPFLFPIGDRVPHWDDVVSRAEGAPADVVPGLLASTLKRAGVPARADASLVGPALMVADRGGRIDRFDAAGCRARRCPEGLSLVSATPPDLRRMAARIRDQDLLIAIERAPPQPRQQLAIGIAGRGFDGQLTSESTRLRGLVLSTDIAPTILARYGISVPGEMTGEPITTEGGRDAGAVSSLQRRLARVGPRRKTVIGVNVLVWVALAVGASLASRGRAGGAAVRMLALSAAYLPGMLLVGAALEPSLPAERLLVGIGAPALAALTLLVVRGYGALAVACAVTVAAYAADMVAGSPLTALSLMGPNPSIGVRFFGIGNELEAALASLVMIGTGAGLAAWLPADRRRAAAAWFAGLAGVSAVIFSAGRFGADVGAAIVLAAGAAAAIVTVTGARRRAALLILAAPVAGLGALVALDLVLGGDAHLSRSVLDAGGLHEVGDVLERRIRLSARSFARPRNSTLLPLAAVTIVLGVVFRHRIAAWFGGRRAALAGFVGGVAVTGVGTLANDSGALLLLIGTGYLSLFAGFAWAEADRAGEPNPASPNATWKAG